MLHLPAIAHEAKVNIDVNVANEVSARTPNLCHLAPAGHTYMEDLNEAGGVYAVMKELSKKNLINLGCLTATGEDGRRERSSMREIWIRRSSGRSKSRIPRPAVSRF